MSRISKDKAGSGAMSEWVDSRYMARCIQLARKGMMGAPPNPMVGAVIVYQNRIIGEGFHQRCGGPHAEVNAIRSVRQPELLKESTLYVSLEPCSHYGKTPPCADLIIEKGIPRVVVGCMDPFAKVNGAGISKLREAGVKVVVGVMERECRELNARFITFHQEHRPWILLKWAQSSDGFIARKDGSPVAFSTPFTQALVHRLRAYSQAIMVGSRTVLTDNPSLTTRYWDGPSPLRFTIDSQGILPQACRLRDDSAATIVYDKADLSYIMNDMYQRGIQSLIVEGGSTLLQAFLDAGLWDAIRVEQSPIVLGEGISAPVLPAEMEWQRCEIDGNEVRKCLNKLKTRHRRA